MQDGPGALVRNNTSQTPAQRVQIIFSTVSIYYWNVAALNVFCPSVLGPKGGH